MMVGMCVKQSEYCAQLTIRNEGDRPRVIWVEPIPCDYTLLPGEELTIIARDPQQIPGFSIVEDDGPSKSATQVHIRKSPNAPYDDFDVIQNGVNLESGHNRHMAIDAGLDA
jgi:hypothetical protein